MLDGCTPWPKEFADLYREQGYWRGESLIDVLTDAAHRYGSRTALVDGDRRFTYRDLDRWSARMAAGFHRRRIAAGDRVVVQLPNQPEFVAVFFALVRIGAKPVFALPAHRAAEIRHLCQLSGAVAYITPGVHRGFDYPAMARRIRDEVPSLRQLIAASPGPDGLADDVALLQDVDDEPVDFPALDPSDVAFFLLSGGTTALPKLIPRTHDDYAYQSRAAARVAGVTAGDVYLTTLPVEFNFTWGCPGIIGCLQTGATVVFAADPTPENCFASIERERVTFTSVVPSIAQLWMESLEWLEPDLSSLRFLQIGSAKLHPRIAARVQPAFGCRLQQVFGMAEGLLTLTREDDSEETVLTTQGTRLSPADEIRIVDEQGADVAPGATGELLARGPYTLRGYYRAPEHNERAFTEDGFYRSGDLARLTADGRLVIEGRLKDVVIRGGDKISAAEVEEHLLTHPRVARAAVVPAPDEFLGERVCAYIVARGEPPTLAELKRALSDRGLAEFKLPERVEFLDELPLTGLGKVDKKALIAAARGDAEPKE